jgi:hypothetical protein
MLTFATCKVVSIPKTYVAGRKNAFDVEECWSRSQLQEELMRRYL